MKRLCNLLAICLVGFSLAGCATFQKIEAAYQTVTSATVSPQAVIVAADSFDVVKITATNYLRLKRCSGSNGPICRDPVLTPKIIAWVKSGTVARDSLKAFLRAHPGQLGDQGLYDILTASTSSLTSALAAYQANAK